MLLRVDLHSPEPLYRQIAAQVRRQILDGSLPDGEKLPAAKVLATSLGVNLHTVLKAYGCLRDEGLIQMRRGRGTRVSSPEHLSPSLSAMARSLLDEAHRQGVSAEAVSVLLSKLDASLEH